MSRTWAEKKLEGIEKHSLAQQLALAAKDQEIDRLTAEVARYREAAIEAETILIDLTEKLLWYADEKGAIMAPQIRSLVQKATQPPEDLPPEIMNHPPNWTCPDCEQHFIVTAHACTGKPGTHTDQLPKEKK